MPEAEAAAPIVVDAQTTKTDGTGAGATKVSDDNAAPEPSPRRWLIFAVVSMALFMASVDHTVVAIALPSIQADLGSGLEWASWTVTIYSLGQVLIMPLAGKLSDQFGRKKVFVIAVVLFTVASLLCGLVDNIYLLVVLRGIQAIGGGAFMPAATGIVADNFGPNRDRAVGMFTSVFPIGGIVGPILGGILLTYWDWRAIFLVNVPIGVLLLVLALIVIPESRQAVSRRLDVYGVVLLGVLILGLMLGVTSLGSKDSSPLSPQFLVPEAIAIVALVLFLRHSSRGKAPFIPMRLLKGRGFGVMNLINFLQGAAAIGFGALVPLFAQARFGIPILESGTLMTARAVGMICIAGLAVMTLRRTGYRLPMVLGFSLLSVGMVAICFPPPGMHQVVWLALAAGVTGLGMGLSVPAGNNAVLQLAPNDAAGIAGLRGMFRQSGSIMAISIATAVMARSDNPGATLSIVFLIFAGLIICTLPLVFKVPEHKGSW
ncbi:MFS transporter [Microlunatus speluncae]|uniref:MFS transporter n=1 Tax=Microlunatus speluncae TaxID=2594267 RepID=UPI001FE2661D|nr:MFS transporter [Microlunatus speluncae]